MPDTGQALHAIVEELFPICRSITGDGVRETLRIIQKHLPAPLALSEVPTGTPVLDWTVPNEWNIRDAYVADASGRRVIDFRRSNLHVVNYSTPIRTRLSLAELRPHLHTIPDRPDWIPYRTSYYQETWGFCLRQRELDALPDGEYEVCIDTTLAPGHLSYGELVIPGAVEDEVVLSTHVCHPSLANDNLSAIAIATALARHISERPHRYSYRFIFAPGTIGAITWLERNRARVGRVRHGLTMVCLGDASQFTYKRTLSGRAAIDRAVIKALADSGHPHDVIDFFPYGYDERQYNSPGFRLPVGSLMRGRHGRFPEYHTSGDNLSFVTAERLEESFAVMRSVVDILEGDVAYRNLAPEGEPQLGRRGLYRAMGGTNIPDLNMAMLWALTLSDGEHTLLDVAEQAKMPFRSIRAAADLLLEAKLLAER